MRYYRFPEKKAWKICFAAFLFLQLLLVRDTLINNCLIGFEKSQYLAVGLMGLAGAAFLAVNRKQWKQILLDQRMLAAVVFALVLLVPMLVKRDWQMMYLSILISIFFAVFLSCFITWRETARYYVLIMTVLGVYSVLATYGLRLLGDSGAVSVPVFVNSANREFYNFGLAYVSIVLDKTRNFGIFREPGVYQFFLILALYLNNYVLTWDKSWKFWAVNGILAVTMLSTFATGGVIEMGLLAVVIFFDKKLYRDKQVRVAVAAAIGILAIALVVIIAQKGTLYKELYKMVIKLVRLNGSSGPRVEAIFKDIEIFLHNPIFGEKLANVMYAVEHNTTSTLLLYAILGAAGGTLNVAAWVALVWEKERKIWVNLALLLIFFMAFNTQNLITDIFFWLFPVMALLERGLPLLKGKLWNKNC